MATYLVLKRVKEDWVSLPGELLIDPPATTASLLIARGFIVPVPDNYPGTVSKPLQSEVPSSAAEVEPPPLADSPNLEQPQDRTPEPALQAVVKVKSKPTLPSRPVAKARVTRRR